MISKFCLIIFSFVILTSCHNLVVSLSKPWLLDIEPPPGPIEFQTAFIDGCLAGNQFNNQNVAASSSRLRLNPNLFKKKNLYRSTYGDAATYCNLWYAYIGRNDAAFFKPSFKLNIKTLPFSRRRSIIEDAPPGPENFRLGWKDGCKTGKAATGKNNNKIAYGFVKDARFIEGDGFNSEYEKGWQTSFTYCQRYFDIIDSPARRSFL